MKHYLEVNQVYQRMEQWIEVKDNLIISFPEMGKAIRYIHFYNPEGRYIGEIIHGFSSFPKVLIYSEEKTSLNAQCHQLATGHYRIEIMTYQIPGIPLETTKGQFEIITDLSIKEWGEMLATYSEDIFQSDKDDERVNAQWYRGDFHAHTYYSDGKLKHIEVDDYLDWQGLDFIALTEHNTVVFGSPDYRHQVIPAFELTYPTGHLNIFGLEQPKLFSSFALMTIAQGNERISQQINQLLAEYKGRLISLNHPFSEPWQWQYDALDLTIIDTIEVINDPTYPGAKEANDKAIAFLDFIWQQGLRLYGLGGSDAHNRQEERYQEAVLPSIYGDPTTHIRSRDLTTESILRAAKAGHSWIGRFVDLEIVIDNGRLLPGDQIVDERTFDYRVTLRVNQRYLEGEPEEVNYVKRLIETGKGVFIVNNRVVSEIEYQEKDQEFVLVRADRYIQGTYGYLRFGFYGGDGHALVYVNPIYKGHKTPEITTFGYWLERFNKKIQSK